MVSALETWVLKCVLPWPRLRHTLYTPTLSMITDFHAEAEGPQIWAHPRHLQRLWRFLPHMAFYSVVLWSILIPKSWCQPIQLILGQWYPATSSLKGRVLQSRPALGNDARFPSASLQAEPPGGGAGGRPSKAELGLSSEPHVAVFPERTTAWWHGSQNGALRCSSGCESEQKIPPNPTGCQLSPGTWVSHPWAYVLRSLILGALACCWWWPPSLPWPLSQTPCNNIHEPRNTIPDTGECPITWLVSIGMRNSELSKPSQRPASRRLLDYVKTLDKTCFSINNRFVKNL